MFWPPFMFLHLDACFKLRVLVHIGHTWDGLVSRNVYKKAFTLGLGRYNARVQVSAQLSVRDLKSK